MDTERLNRVCGSFRTRLRRLLLEAGVGRLVVVAIGLLGLLLLLDWWSHLGAPLRMLMLVGYLAAVGATAWWTLLSPLDVGRARGVIVAIVLLAALFGPDPLTAMTGLGGVVAMGAVLLYWVALGAVLWVTLRVPLRGWSDREVLSYVDSVVPRGQGMLLDLHELTQAADQIEEVRSPVGQELANTAVEELAGLVGRVRLAATLRRRNVNRWLLGAGAAFLLLGVVAVGLPDHLSAGTERFFNPFSDTRWPHRTTIADVTCRIRDEVFSAEAETGLAVPQLESMTVQATVTGEVPTEVTLYFRSEKSGYWDKAKLAVSDKGHVQYTFEGVRDPLDFYMVGGDYDTNKYHVGIIERPFLTDILARYDFPDYAGIPDRQERGGQLAGLEGTRVDVTFTSSMALNKAFLVPEEGEKEELALASPKTFKKTFLLAQNASYGIELHEKHGFREARPERIDIRVTPDKPPKVQLLSPRGDPVQTNRAAVEVAFRATDDFGLKKVVFLYKMDDGEPIVLTDKITGPISQIGKMSEARFDWPLRKSELPESGTLSCFVRVEDINPTGRGKVESSHARVRLLRPTDFQLEVLERTKGLLGEARLAWLNQLDAYAAGLQWLKEGTGKEEDELWLEMKDKQDRAFRAGRAMRQHMQGLTEQYTRNQMGREFMSVRLGKIADLINQLIDTEHTAISEGLRAARPTSAADAAPQRLRKLRGDALGKFKDNQKMSVLILEQALRKLYDWRDLQTSTVTTKLMIEQQEEVIEKTREIAPLTIGQDRLDLPEKVLDKLLTLGKQQRAVYDTETGLERQLSDLILKARRQKRTSIRAPLWAAFRGLRANRVNDHLKEAALMIERNQPSQVTGDQEKAIRALRLVEAGLVVAGQRIDKDEPLTLAMNISPKADFEEWVVKPPGPGETPTTQPEVITISQEELEKWIPEKETALSSAIRLSLEYQDNVLARTHYLSKNNSSVEMPRFVLLKQLMVVERQGAAFGQLKKAVKEADKAGAPPVKGALAGEREEFDQFVKLAADKDVSKCHQRAQADSITCLQDLLQLIAWEAKVEDMANENREQNGIDKWGREYLLRGPDLDAVVAAIDDLDYAWLLEKDVVRKLDRWAKFPPKSPLMTSIEKTNRARASKVQKRVSGLVDGILAKIGTLSAESEGGERVSQTGVGGLPELKLVSWVGPVATGKVDGKQLAALGDAAQAMGSTVNNLRDLLEERVKPPVVAVGPATQPEQITQEEFDRLTSRDYIAGELKKNEQLASDVRERVLRALSKDFPPKYRDLLALYYASFVKEEEKAPE